MESTLNWISVPSHVHFIYTHLSTARFDLNYNKYVYVCIYMYIYISIINIYAHVYLIKSLAQSFIQQVSPRL